VGKTNKQTNNNKNHRLALVQPSRLWQEGAGQMRSISTATSQPRGLRHLEASQAAPQSQPSALAQSPAESVPCAPRTQLHSPESISTLFLLPPIPLPAYPPCLCCPGHLVPTLAHALLLPMACRRHRSAHPEVAFPCVCQILKVVSKTPFFGEASKDLSAYLSQRS
jgi:hypothetical protein